jgi:mRNA interferase MazF
VAAASGDYGKPRPHVVVQSDRMRATESVILSPITSDLVDAPFRMLLQPNPDNGLRQASHVMADKLITIRRERVSSTIGRLTDNEMRQLDARLVLVLGLRP